MDKSGEDTNVVGERLNSLLLIQQNQTPQTAGNSSDGNPPATGKDGGAKGSAGGTTDAGQTDQQTPPDDVITKGKTALQSGDHKTALSAANQILASDPKNVDALQLRAQSEYLQGDSEAARKDSQALLSIDPSNQLARLILDGSKGLSDATIKRALKRPDFGWDREGEPGQGGGRAQTRKDAQPRQSAQAQSKVALTYQSPAAALIGSIESKLQMKDLTGALDEANRAVAADPSSAKALALRARIWNQMGNAENALKDADEALKREPDNVAALLERGYAEYQLGKYQDALKDVERALSIEPLNAMGYLYKGMILEKLDRTKEAIAAYLRAAELDGGLKPLVDDALARLGALAGAGGKGASSGARPWPKLALFGAIILAALGLLFKGVKRAIKPEWATPTTPPAPRTPSIR
jgi:tetratricopeptide (TPR) repeat protein